MNAIHWNAKKFKFNDRLARLRINKGWTKAELAAMIHSTSNLIIKYESGETDPGLARIREFKKIFNCTWNELLGE